MEKFVSIGYTEDRVFVGSHSCTVYTFLVAVLWISLLRGSDTDQNLGVCNYYFISFVYPDFAFVRKLSSVILSLYNFSGLPDFGCLSDIYMYTT